MPRPGLSLRSVSEPRIVDMLKRGVDSDVARARLEWSDAESIARAVRPLAGKRTIKPNVLPTAQVSGRWSTTDPPRLTWPAHDDQQCPECEMRRKAGNFHPDVWCARAVREVAEPNPGTWWLKGDAEAIEARLAAAYTNDTEDLEAFASGYDIHAITMCGMWSLPMPPIRTKKGINSSPECEGWRREVRWGGESDRRRHAAKSFRYAWQYTAHERGVLQVKALHTLGLSTDEILKYARDYKNAKPGFFAARQQHMDKCARHKEARTFLGRLRRLYGDQTTRMKEGWSHMVQGAVSDIVNIVAQAWYNHPDFGGRCEFISNGYDALEMAFPSDITPEFVIPRVRDVVERTWDVGGVKVHLPWSWHVVTPS
jgi:hypothetical protein